MPLTPAGRGHGPLLHGDPNRTSTCTIALAGKNAVCSPDEAKRNPGKY